MTRGELATTVNRKQCPGAAVTARSTTHRRVSPMCKPIVPRAPIAAQTDSAQDDRSIDTSDYNGWVSWDAWVVDLYLDNERDLYAKQYALMDRILSGELSGVQI